MDELFDLHAERLQVGGRDRIPMSLWSALYLIISLGMWSVGFQAGALGIGPNWPASILNVAFALVVMLISDLDHPQAGFLRVGQLPLEDLQRTLHRGAQ